MEMEMFLAHFTNESSKIAGTNIDNAMQPIKNKISESCAK